MNVLLINNYYYNRGGDCTYLFSLKNLLKERNNNVIVFSMHHPLNFESEYSKYFVSYINYDEEVRSQTFSSGLKVAKRTIYSTEAKRNIEELIINEKPDIAHIQNIHHHITPSIFRCLKKHNIPIVWTLHDYSMICPNTSFLSNGKICEKCKKKKYFWPAIVKCKKNSFAASTMAAIEKATHEILKFYDQVDFFISPSLFLKNKLIEYGFDAERIVHLNNFICFQDVKTHEENNENYFMYLGRLSEEKGIQTLLDAASQVFNDSDGKKIFSNYKLKIVGDGPLKNELKAYIKAKGIEDYIELLGHRSHDEAIALLKGSKFLVVPSEWYENFPYSVLEAFSLGKPVIASKIGGIPELVKNWDTGLIFNYGDADALALKIKFLIRHPEKSEKFGENAQEFISTGITPEKHYQALMKVYERAIEGVSPGKILSRIDKKN